MKTRITALCLFMVVLSCLLAGCGCEHEWDGATCLIPKTCTLCQTTEGEALGHSWSEATCANPKHCIVCNEIDGEALPHSWVEANYQDPQTCSECGVTEGEPLLADFEKNGFQTIKPEKGKTYDYVTVCYDNTEKKTVGKLEIREYMTTSEMRANGEDSPYNLPYKEGFVWKFISFDVAYSDDNAWKYGFSSSNCIENYYAIEEWDNSVVDEISDSIREYTINYNGQEETIVYKEINSYNSGWINKVNHWYLDIAFQIPEGYDGVVFGFFDAATEWKDGMYIYDIADENTLFFRLD